MLATKKDFIKMKTIFKSPNVFPPYDYQDLINHKNKYYDYLEKNVHQCFTFRLYFIKRNQK